MTVEDKALIRHETANDLTVLQVAYELDTTPATAKHYELVLDAVANLQTRIGDLLGES